VSVSPNEKVTNFSSTLPDYKTVLRAPFREWAESALPSEYESRIDGFGHTTTNRPVHSADIAGSQEYTIGLQEDGLPLLPVFDLDLVAPNDARLILKAYIELTWSEFLTLS